MLSSWKKVVKNLRCSSIVLGVSNVCVIALGGSVILLSPRQFCYGQDLLAFYMIMAAAGVRILAMVRCAIHQQAAAVAILGSSPDNPVASNNISRLERRLRYKRWACWTRFATAVSAVQFVLAIYLLFMVVKMSNGCIMGLLTIKQLWKQNLLIVFLIMVCFVAILQCFSSADILRWRSFYETQDHAWRAHYEEVFDHGIREVFCCLGRTKYMRSMEEDEVYSVAQLLGDLVTYRASGTGHLELLAGMALLQRHNQYPKLDESSVDAPIEVIQEAFTFHPFAEAAYTGPLLDVGRNPILFPCTWLFRQGILTACRRNRRPVLEGDNWWRGHAAAFLKYAKIPPESLRRGRVNQGKCQAAYFIVVLHHMRSLVIAVRGTETPEDLITDGLCRETSLTMEDLDGLINGTLVDPMMRECVRSSFPQYGHSGIVEAARELFKQIEGRNSAAVNGDNDDASDSGFLSSLLGPGCECEGYAVRVVGHSLGGAIAAMVGIRLHGRFPDLRVYSYGPLPCVDSVVAFACSSFVTCIVHDTEFSSYLSINSILRLRASALTSMSQGTSVDTDMTNKMAQVFLCVSKEQKRKAMDPLPDPPSIHSAAEDSIDGVQIVTESSGKEYSFLGDESQMKENNNENGMNDTMDDFTSPIEDPVSNFMDVVPSTESISPNDPPEVFLAGLVIHMIRVQRGISIKLPLWRGRGSQQRQPSYRAILADRENFKEILVSPNMFFDHLPWKCHHALKRVLESRNQSTTSGGNGLSGLYQFFRAPFRSAFSRTTPS